MNEHELHVLRARFWDAKMHNFKIGGAEAHVEALQAMVGKLPGDGSVDHLIELVDQALSGKRVAHPEVKKVAPKAPKAEAKPEPKPEVKPAPKAETKTSELPAAVKVSKASKEEAKPDAKTLSGVLPEMPSEKPAEPAADKVEDDFDFNNF